MVFRSFTPLEFDPKTGLTPAGKKSNNVLNGVYAVRMVTHTFAGGVFTQQLHGNRDPNINLSNVNLLAHLGVFSDSEKEDNEYFANEAIESLNSADERIVGENGLNIRVDALTGEGQITDGGANISEEAFGPNPLAWPDPFGPTPPDEG